jgi:hypothetical protein
MTKYDGRARRAAPPFLIGHWSLVILCGCRVSFALLMLAGYTLTVAVETAVLLVGLSRRHPVRSRLFAGVWLTACTYPVVWLVLPPLFPDRTTYLVVAETFAPAAECALFWLALVKMLTPDRRATTRDMIAIVLANLASFGVGELIYLVVDPAALIDLLVDHDVPAG